MSRPGGDHPELLPRDGAVLQNWSRTVTYSASRLEEPAEVAALCRLVASAPRIRALGTRHSFSAVADTPGVHVSTLQIAPGFELDEQRRIVRFKGGTRYAALATFLTDRGWALHNMGSLPHISVAGAISTGTHGSGTHNGSLATAVRGIRFVGPDGRLRWVRHDDADFDGSVVALGLLGVIAELELAVEPSYLVRQDVYRDLVWDRFLEDVSAVTDAGYSVSIFTDWVSDTIDQVWVKRRVDAADEAVPEELRGARRDPRGTVQVLESADDNATQQGIAGAWSAHLPHFRIDRTPSDGDEIQSEYFVDRSDAVAALSAVRALGDEIRPALLISELRTVAADRLWMSEAYGRDSLAIHFTWQNRPADVQRLCGRIEAALAPFAPRPHWGKVHTIPALELAAHYPRFSEFQQLVRHIDPTGKFAAAGTAGLPFALAPTVADAAADSSLLGPQLVEGSR